MHMGSATIGKNAGQKSDRRDLNIHEYAPIRFVTVQTTDVYLLSLSLRVMKVFCALDALSVIDAVIFNAFSIVWLIS